MIKYKKHLLHSVILFGVLIILIPAGITSGNKEAALPPIQGSPLPGTETELTSNTAPERRPRLSGNLIVWEEWETGTSQIYLYN